MKHPNGQPQALPTVTVVSDPKHANDHNPNGIGIGSNLPKWAIVQILAEAIRIIAHSETQPQIDKRSRSGLTLPDGSAAIIDLPEIPNPANDIRIEGNSDEKPG